MAIELVSTIVPKNNGNFPMAYAKDIQFEDGKTLQEYREEGGTGAGGTGEDGFSPEIIENASNTADSYKLDITTKTGTKTTPNLKGEKGNDGTSVTVRQDDANTETNYKLVVTNGETVITTPNLVGPEGSGLTFAEVKTTGEGDVVTSYKLDITSSEGTTRTPELLGPVGPKGETGDSAFIVASTENTEDIYKLDIHNKDGITTTPNLKGANGVDGAKGDDGFSPVITPNSANNDATYKLDIETKTGTITTPNLMGQGGGGGTGASSAENVSYSNASVTGDDLKEVLDNFFADYYYVEPSVSSFNMTPSTTTYEKGQSVRSLSFTWSFKTVPARQTLTDCSITLEDRSATWSGNISTNKKFTLEYWDARNKNAWRDININFQDKKYWGVAESKNAGDVNSAFVLGLSNSQFATGRNGNITVNAGAGQYVYFCIPTAFGTPTFTVGGFSGGFAKLATIQFTNASGYTVSYDVYKSSNANLGNTTVSVS